MSEAPAQGFAEEKPRRPWRKKALLVEILVLLSLPAAALGAYFCYLHRVDQALADAVAEADRLEANLTGFGNAPPGPKANILPAHMNQFQPSTNKPSLALDAIPLPKGAVARLGSPQFRHDGWLPSRRRSLTYSPDGKLLAASTVDDIIMWDAASGKMLRRLPSHGNATIDFSPDGKTLAAISAGNTVLLEIETGKEIFNVSRPVIRFPMREEIRFSPDGKTLAVRYLVASPSETELLLLDAKTGKERARLAGITWLGPLAISPDSKILAASCGERTSVIDIYDLATGRLLYKLDAEMNGSQFCSLAFSPDGRSLAGGTFNGLKVFELASRKVRAKIDLWPQELHCVAFAPDGLTVVATEHDTAKTHFWDTQTGKIRLELIAAKGIGAVSALSPDGKTLAAETLSGSVIRLWDVATGKEKFPLQGHDTPIRSVAFAKDGKQLVTAGGNEHVHLWDAATGEHLLHYKGIDAQCVAFSPDGKNLAAVGSQYPRSNTALVSVWDFATAKQLLKGPVFNYVNFISFAYFPDGKRLATAAHGLYGYQPFAPGLSIENADDGVLIKRCALEKLFPRTLAISPDGKTVAVGGWSEETEEKARVFLELHAVDADSAFLALKGHQGEVMSVAFSPDGRLLASGSVDTTVRLWSVSSGKEVMKLVGHERAVAAIAVSHDGSILASADGRSDFHRTYRREDFKAAGDAVHRIRLWNIATGKELRCLQGHDTNVTSLAFSPDGSRLVSGLGDGTALVWDVLPREVPAHD